jgi:hypothetical protein
MTTSGANPRDQLEEKIGALAVALLGALGEALEKTPEKVVEVSRGLEARLQTARTIGAVSVAFGKQETTKRVGQLGDIADHLRQPLEHAIAQALGLVDLSGGSKQPVSTGDETADSVTEPSDETDDQSANPNHIIADYDTLTASQVLALVADLAPEDAALLLQYEIAHRNRKTVTARLSAQSGS